MDATFIYTANGVTKQRTITIFAIRGMDEPDDIEKIRVVHDYLNGNIEEQNNGGLKLFSITFSPLISAVDRRFLSAFFLSSNKTVVYGAFISQVVNNDIALISEWLNNIELGRQFTVYFTDTHVYHSFETGGVETDDMYHKLMVKFEGTSDAPETFTTNSGKLALMENGLSFPSFSDATHTFSVIMVPNKKSQFSISIVTNASVSAGNLTWQAFVSDNQLPSPIDGFFWVDIAIFLQAK